MRRLAFLSLLAGAVFAFGELVAARALGQDAPVQNSPSFRRDVIPALTKAGCNAGACHGSFQGRGGFRLSLLGFDPLADYESIALSGRGRRVSPSSPEQSLLLRKPTGRIAHGGGVRFEAGQPAYQILRDYLAAGLPPPRPDEPRITGLEVAPCDVVLKPGESVAVKVIARWSDGSIEEVTDWALFDPRDPTATDVSVGGRITSLRPGKSAVSVRYLGQVASVAVSTPFGAPQAFDFAPANYIDELVLAEWRRMGVIPTPLCTDGEFLRRAHLDLIGTLPTAEEARSFLDSADPDKRKNLVDELLQRPEYVDYWSLLWGDLLRVHRRYVGDKGLGSFAGWLRQSIRHNKSLDRMAHELLTAQGNLFAHGPVAYYFVDTRPEELAETTAQLFLGVRLQCARCHHHPMEVWGQDDYYGLAAFFTRLEVRDSGDKGRFGGMQIVRPAAKETKPLPVAARPRLFGRPDSLDPQASADVRQELARWLTAQENPYFARNFANRYWAWLMGRGLVEPVDDVRATNPPSNPALLDALAKDLADHHYDPRHLVRAIATSRVYQLRVHLAPEIDQDGALFSHRVARRMPAEVLLDAINQVAGSREAFVGQPAGTRAIALPDPAVESEFLTVFGRPPRNSPCQCARQSTSDLLQSLHLVNNAGLQSKIAADTGRVARLVAASKADEEIVEELYLAAYARRPTADELASVRELAAAAAGRRELFEDLLWTLLNSPEFAFNH